MKTHRYIDGPWQASCADPGVNLTELPLLLLSKTGLMLLHGSQSNTVLTQYSLSVSVTHRHRQTKLINRTELTEHAKSIPSYAVQVLYFLCLSINFDDCVSMFHFFLPDGQLIRHHDLLVCVGHEQPDGILQYTFNELGLSVAPCCLLTRVVILRRVYTAKVLACVAALAAS